MVSNIRRVGAMVAVAALAGCSGETRTDSSSPMQQPKVAPVVVEAPEAETDMADFRYDPTGKADPFKSFIRAELYAKDEIVSPLERFDLSQLQVTGIVWNAQRPNALIEDPTGKGHIVGEGAGIGKNKGKIVRIDDNQVIVKETYVDFRDRATSKEVVLHLYERHGG